MLEMMRKSRVVSQAVPGRRLDERGFTLVEMMVVLVLIFLIVGISLPNLQRAIVRADFMGEVKKIKTAVMFSRIHAVKNSRTVALKILDDDDTQEGAVLTAWVDDDGSGTVNGSEEILKEWNVGHPTGNIITLGPDGAASRDLYNLSGNLLGVVFLPNGTAIANASGDIGVGMGSVILEDTKFNQIRVTINAGAGTVIQEMWNYIDDEWTTDMKWWRY
jgi:prepilin-type N-terminal cleavage/methylation domain-containing protein